MQREHETLAGESRSKLTERVRRLALVAERSSNAVLLADADRRVVWVNDAFTAVSGFTRQESVGELFGVLLLQAFEHAQKKCVEASLGGLAVWRGGRAAPLFPSRGLSSSTVLFFLLFFFAR